MAKVIEVKEIPLDDLCIGLGQVRLRDVSEEVMALADSIRKIGLLKPILVAPTGDGRYTIIAGQRRFLAHRKLKRSSIMAAVIERVMDIEAKALSLTTEVTHRDPNSKDLIDACTWLYRKYGSVRAVCEMTGLPSARVGEYVKYDRLRPEMRELVDRGLNLKVALRAQDAASVSGNYDPDEATKFAKEMATMGVAQQEKLVKARLENPEASADDVIQSAKKGSKVTQIVVRLGAGENASLKKFAQDESTTRDDASRTLIVEALAAKGYFHH